MMTRSGTSSKSSFSTCSSCRVTSSFSCKYPASVARPSGGKSEYLIGRQNGLVASVSAGRIILTFIRASLRLRSLYTTWTCHCYVLSLEPVAPECLTNRLPISLMGRIPLCEGTDHAQAAAGRRQRKTPRRDEERAGGYGRGDRDRRNGHERRCARVVHRANARCDSDGRAIGRGDERNRSGGVHPARVPAPARGLLLDPR